MWMPEYLKEAGNVLLKTLEEPPDNTIIILVAENTELILNTILSRTQLIKLNKLQDEDIIEALKEKHAALQETAADIAHLVEIGRAHV